MTVLITAGSGMIGSNVARLLVKEFDEKIVIYGRRPFEPSSSILSDVSDHLITAIGTLTDLAYLLRLIEVEQVDRIVHCAAMLPPADAQRPMECLDVNVIGTATLLEAARLSGVHRIVTLSSAAVMGDPEEMDIPSPEENLVLPPTGMYALSKLTGEYLVHTYREMFGVDAVCVRPTAVWGPGFRPERINPVPGLILSVARGESVSRASGADTKFDLTYVKDEAQGIVRALMHEKLLPYYVYNVSFGRNVSVGDVVQVLQDVRPDVKVSIGPGLWAGVLARGRQRDTQYRASQRPAQDVTRARRDFGYEPAWPVERAIPDFMRWFETGQYDEQ